MKSSNRIYCDGAAIPNPGKKIIAVVCPDINKEIVEETGYGTNSEAEYEAFIRALEFAKDLGLKKFTLCSDSMLVLKQLAGAWSIKQEKFLAYKEQFDKLKENFEEVDFEWVRGEINLAHKKIERLYPNQIKIFSFKRS
jgi:ribonuclease HI